MSEGMMILESAAFANGGSIPTRHTCDGQDVSPPLSWRDVPAGTESLVLIVDDPDAPGGTWVHWVVFNVEPSTTEIPEGASGSGALPSEATEGTNGWGGRGYRGPCPPSGTHRYFFRILALDRSLDISPSASATEVSHAAEGSVLAEATLVGRYARSRRASA